MRKNSSLVYSIFLILLCLNSIIYFNPDYSQNQDFKSISENDIPSVIDDDKTDEIIDETNNNIDFPIRKIDTPGNFQTKAFFFYNDWLDIDSDGLGFELEEYEIMKDDGANCLEIRPRFDSTDEDGLEYTWPPDTTNFHEFTSPYNPHEKSHFFTPVFSEETYIKGKVYFVTHITNQWDTSTPTIDFRIRLFLHNTTDNSNSLIASTAEYGIDYEFWSSPQRIYTINLPSEYTIPAGYRLKIKFDGRISTLDETGEFKIYCAEQNIDDTYVWTIDDGVYSNTYTVLDVDRIFGVQFYMNNDYPSINVAGFTNNTKYYQRKNVTITTTGATNSSYNWDGDSYVDFVSSTWVWSPETHGWHYLYVQALDDHNNNRTLTYKIGFDESITNIELTNFSNGSNIGDTSELHFNPFNITYAMYEWNKNGTQMNMTEQNYQIPVPSEETSHNLTVTTYDEFESVKYFYIFFVDASYPIIFLDNVLNDTVHPPGKVIDVNITDFSQIEVYYKWDSQDKLPWSPFSSDIYRTYLPGIDVPHFLYVYANDSFGHYSEKMYKFTTDSTVFSVELQNMINNSYYSGDNIVEVLVSGSNTTVLFSWDGGAEKNGILIDDTLLILNNSDVLPPIAGIHFLTIRTFNISDVEHTFVFKFTVDREPPTIDSSIYDYNNERYRTSDYFTFILGDNITSSADLVVLYSINGNENHTLTSPYNFYLTFFIDGTYNLTLFVYDTANNFATSSIIFIIDMTPPSLSSIDFERLVQILGSNYIPANITIDVVITDDDPTIQSTYSWGGVIYYPFVGSFNLDFTSGTSILYINASDSLGNHDILYDIELTIDNIAPTSIIISPLNDSKINHDTKLKFNVDDINIYTIKEVEYSWDLFYPARSPITYDSSGDFELNLHHLYLVDGSAMLYIFTEDVVGNTETYVFNFVVDLTSPTPAFYIEDPPTQLLEEDTLYYVTGNTSIWYNASENDDIASIFFYWNGDEENDQSLNITDAFIYIPTDDGLYNITIILEDDTQGSHPNRLQVIYLFYVDDIKIEVINPLDLLTITHNIIYEDTFTFTIKIYDVIEETAIENLFWNQTSLNNSNNLNLIITNTTINNQTFQFSIYATNVGDTSLVFEFSKADSNKHIITVNFSIAKKEGYLIILERSNINAIYENDILINVTLKDDNGINQTVTLIFANDTQIDDFTYLGNDVYQFQYSSYRTVGKGNYILDIRVESAFYYGQTNSSYIVEFTVLPIPLRLEIFVPEYNVTEGNNFIIYGLLSFINGTPLEDIDIIFYIYIYYKNNTEFVYAFTGYDIFETLLGNTNSTGYATVTFLMSEDISYIGISAIYEGNNFLGSISFELEELIRSQKPPGLPSSILYGIIAGSILLIAIISFVIYKVTRTKPFEQLMEEVEDSEILASLVEINPGVILNIFDQQKGAIPLIGEHNLDGIYKQRLPIGVDNFLLRAADQAYSSLGFEEMHDRRRIGSIILPNEGMIGFIHGIQLPNPAARGGFENLTLVVLVNEEHDKELLGNQTYLYEEIDDLIVSLKEKKHLNEIREHLVNIRKKSTRIVLAALKGEE